MQSNGYVDGHMSHRLPRTFNQLTPECERIPTCIDAPVWSGLPRVGSCKQRSLFGNRNIRLVRLATSYSSSSCFRRFSHATRSSRSSLIYFSTTWPLFCTYVLFVFRPRSIPAQLHETSSTSSSLGDLGRISISLTNIVLRPLAEQT